jgi:hypothetical protein
MDEEKLIILVQGHECLYNLQHKDYDNSLVKDNCWEEIAEELHAQGKKLSHSTVGELQGRGRIAAASRHCRGRGTAWYV